MPALQTFEQAFIGRVMVIPADQEVPNTWVDCDGTRVLRSQRPQYFEAIGSTSNFIDLPKQHRVTEGMRAVIKLGKKT